MSSHREYHNSVVRHPIPAPVAVFGLLVLTLILASTSLAQFTQGSAPQAPGTSANIPRPTGGGHPFTGAVVPPTGPVRPVTGATNTSVPFSTGHVPGSRTAFPGENRNDRHHHRHDRDHYGEYLVPYAVAIPYQAENAITDEDAEPDDDADYQGGPTVFDRRGSGEDSYVPPVEKVPTPHSRQLADADQPADTTPQPLTLLVFKDGHKIEVENYAIVGPTLFDLTPGHTRRVSIVSLDLDATRQQNEDRGIIFQLPGSLPGN